MFRIKIIKYFVVASNGIWYDEAPQVRRSNMVDTARFAHNMTAKPAADKTTEVAYVVGAIFLASLVAPVVILAWSLLKSLVG